MEPAKDRLFKFLQIGTLGEGDGSFLLGKNLSAVYSPSYAKVFITNKTGRSNVKACHSVLREELNICHNASLLSIVLWLNYFIAFKCSATINRDPTWPVSYMATL